MADAIERVKLIELTVSRLVDDPAYQRAMSQAADDRKLIEATEQVVKLVDASVGRVLGLSSLD